MKNPKMHLWIVGMIFMACGTNFTWKIFGIIIIIFWLISFLNKEE